MHLNSESDAESGSQLGGPLAHDPVGNEEPVGVVPQVRLAQQAALEQLAEPLGRFRVVKLVNLHCGDVCDMIPEALLPLPQLAACIRDRSNLHVQGDCES